MITSSDARLRYIVGRTERPEDIAPSGRISPRKSLRAFTSPSIRPGHFDNILLFSQTRYGVLPMCKPFLGKYCWLIVHPCAIYIIFAVIL